MLLFNVTSFKLYRLPIGLSFTLHVSHGFIQTRQHSYKCITLTVCHHHCTLETSHIVLTFCVLPCTTRTLNCYNTVSHVHVIHSTPANSMHDKAMGSTTQNVELVLHLSFDRSTPTQWHYIVILLRILPLLSHTTDTFRITHICVSLTPGQVS